MLNNIFLKEYSTDLPQINIPCKQSLSNNFVVVEDNGINISSEIIEDIFIPFFTTKENGSGVGLSVSRHILRLHTGMLKVYSSKGHNTQFVLVLPK